MLGQEAVECVCMGVCLLCGEGGSYALPPLVSALRLSSKACVGVCTRMLSGGWGYVYQGVHGCVNGRCVGVGMGVNG